MRELRSEIEIDAPAERVWDVLVRFQDYPEWNPFIKAAQGDLRMGAKIRITVVPPEGRSMTFSPRLLVVEPARELRWLGRVGLPGIFDGEHSFILEPLGGGRTRVVQHERFRGLLAPVMGRKMYAATQRGFDDLMRALKERAEETTGRAGSGKAAPHRRKT